MASTSDSLAVDTASREPEPAPCYDNFYSPENRAFYAQKPYQPLSSSNPQIRLLKLIPPSISGEHPLSFQLLDQVRLEVAQGSYTALSYCAGDPKKTAPVLINGIAFNAFANLGLALQEAVVYWKENALDWENYYLWADQICINQSNINDRSHQVGMMRDIYASAARVLICLDVCGSESEGNAGMRWATRVRDQVPKFGQRPRVEKLLTVEEASIIWSEHARYINRRKEEHLKLPSKEEVDLLNFQQGIIAFLGLIHRPWWRRAWICQEFIFAAAADFASGGISISWESLYRILFFYYWDLKHFQLVFYISQASSQVTGGDIISSKYGYHRTDQLISVRNLFSQKVTWTGPGDIKVWLAHAGSCETSDPRDRVFAFLSLASSGYNIELDYSPSKTWGALLIEVTSKTLAHEKTLDFLEYTRSSRRSANENGLPSWIPTWTMDRKYTINHDKHLFSQFPPPVIFGSILKLAGYKLDTLMEKKIAACYTWGGGGLFLEATENGQTRPGTVFGTFQQQDSTTSLF